MTKAELVFALIHATRLRQATISERVHSMTRYGSPFCVAVPSPFSACLGNCWQLMQEFDRSIGFKYLKGLHLNDSKSTLGSGLDRHEKIGKGCVGLEAFRFIMNDCRLDGIPLILETPADSDDNDLAVAGYRRELLLLRSLVGTLPAAGSSPGSSSPPPKQVSASLSPGPVAKKKARCAREDAVASSVQA
jgi:hypothetical protein